MPPMLIKIAQINNDFIFFIEDQAGCMLLYLFRKIDTMRVNDKSPGIIDNAGN